MIKANPLGLVVPLSDTATIQGKDTLQIGGIQIRAGGFSNELVTLFNYPTLVTIRCR
jgi:hypothetical protein